MKRNDLFLISIILVIGIVILGFSLINSENIIKRAEIYYRNELVKTVNLSANQEFEIEGKLGLLVIEVKDGMIRVKSETSPRNFCSRQGFVQRVGEMIICLPNEVFIRIVGQATNEVFIL